MKLVANIKLLPTPEQEALLQQTLERCNEACNWLSGVAFETKTFRHFALQKIAYRDIRDRFGLTAQVAIRCLAKVADAYNIDTDKQRQFRPHSAQPFDDRVFRFLSDDQLSIWTLGGRQKISYVCGDHQRRLLAHRKGEVDLMLVRGNWYLAVVCDFDDPTLIEATDVLGVDFGIVNIATDSDNGSTHPHGQFDPQIAYIAGLFDGEGCISGRDQHNSRLARITILIAASHVPVLGMIQTRFGGRIKKQTACVNKVVFVWEEGTIAGCLNFLDTIRPFLFEKADQADVALAYLRARVAVPRLGNVYATDELVELGDQTVHSLRNLKRTSRAVLGA